jgi:hypothetical protein
MGRHSHRCRTQCDRHDDADRLLREERRVPLAVHHTLAAKLRDGDTTQPLRTRLVARPLSIVEPDLPFAHRWLDARRAVAVWLTQRVGNRRLHAHLTGDGLADAARQPGVHGVK